MSFGKFFRAATIAALGLGAVCASSLFSDRAYATAAAGEDVSAVIPIPEGEVEVSPDDLKISVISSTRTETSQAFKVTASSQFDTYSVITYGNMFITVNDPSFVDEPSDGENIPVYEASLFRIAGTKEQYSDVIVPKYLSYGTRFKLHISSIAENCVEDDYLNITSILIHDEITEIDSLAFPSVPETVQFRCMAASEPEGWATLWTSADSSQITWGYHATTKERTTMETYRSNGTRAFGSGKNFMVGYHGEGELYQPLLLQYSLEDEKGATIEPLFRHIEVPLTSPNTNFDAVGSTVGSTSLTIDIDIDLPEGASVIKESLSFHNIYYVKEVVKSGAYTFLPDLDQGPLYSNPSHSYVDAYHFSQFFDYRLGRCSSFSGYTQVDINFDKVYGIYEELKPGIYAQNKAAIDSGEIVVRYQFSSLSRCKYRIKYRNAAGEIITKTPKVETPIDYFLVTKDKGNEMGFIFNDASLGDGFSYQSLVSVELEGFYIKADLYSNAKKAIINKSSVSLRFAYLTLMEAAHPAGYANLNLIWILTAVIYAVVFAGIATGYYFYAKRKFRNDEFRRMNTKNYLKAAGKNSIGFGIVTMAILAIISRWGIMATSVVAFNPLDVYVIVFTVAGLIFLGFTIKNLVVSFKNARKRREALRLKLDQDKADDGTN